MVLYRRDTAASSRPEAYGVAGVDHPGWMTHMAQPVLPAVDKDRDILSNTRIQTHPSSATAAAMPKAKGMPLA